MLYFTWCPNSHRWIQPKCTEVWPIYLYRFSGLSTFLTPLSFLSLRMMFVKPFFTAATRCLLSLLLLLFLFVNVRLGLGTGHMDALSHRTHTYITTLHYIALYFTRSKHVRYIQTSKSILIEESLLLLVLFRILNRKVTMDLFLRGSLSKINPGSRIV